MKLDESRSRLYDQLRRRPKAHFSGNHALYHYNIPTTSDLMQERMFRNDKKKAPRPPRESLPNLTLKSQVGSARPPQALQDWAPSFPRLQLLRIGADRPQTCCGPGGFPYKRLLRFYLRVFHHFIKKNNWKLVSIITFRNRRILQFYKHHGVQLKKQFRIVIKAVQNSF